MNSFRGGNRLQGMLMPYDVSEWLPESHLARFVVDVTDRMDFSRIYNSYAGKGKEAYDPKLLVSLLFYGYSTGMFSSRKIEAATYDSVAFRYIAGNEHPDHDTICAFRKRFVKDIQGWFKDILLIGKEMGLLRMGNIYIDGTKIQANAGRHKAMSYAYMQKIESQLETEIKQLLDMGAARDELEKDQGLDMPKELQRRQDRLDKIQAAMKVVKERAKERYDDHKQEYDEKIAARDKQKSTGKKPRGREPKQPDSNPQNTGQYNFTDPESRIMKTPRGFEQCYNAQTAVNEDMIIVGAYSNSHGNDKQEYIPTVECVDKELGTITAAIADTGYFSKHNEATVRGMNIMPIIAKSKERHNSFLKNHLADKEASRQGPDCYKQSQDIKAIYKKRKETVEPVFGIIKETLGFRRFSLRGQELANAEWALVCLAYNLKRLFKLSIA